MSRIKLVINKFKASIYGALGRAQAGLEAVEPSVVGNKEKDLIEDLPVATPEQDPEPVVKESNSDCMTVKKSSAARKKPPAPPKNKPGRPKGSQNISKPQN